MISIPGSLSFAKLVMMSPVPAKSEGGGVGGARYAIQDHSFVDRSIVPYNIDSKRNYECVLSTSNAIVIILLKTSQGQFLHLCTPSSTSFHEVKPNLLHSSGTVRRSRVRLAEENYPMHFTFFRTKFSKLICALAFSEA